MNKYFLTFVLLFSIANEVCAEHYILGTASYFLSGKWEVISDIEVNDLKIRHVRKLDAKTCAKSSQHRDHIEMSGPINPDTPFIIERLIKRIDDSPNRCMSPDTGNRFAIEIYLNSGGGFMKDGYELGNLFRDKQIETKVAGTAECYSSCATAFLGGYYREIDKGGKLMFHAPYSYNSVYDISCSNKDTQLLAYMKKMLNETDGAFLYQRTMSYCSQSSGWSLNKDAAELFGLLTNH